MTKEMIRVPVGCEPKISSYRFGGGIFIDYGYPAFTLDKEAELDKLISALQKAQVKYRDRYQNMRFVERNDCGCPYDCSCSPTYALYGERYETDLEYNYRLADDKKRKEEQEARERKEFERLQAKFS